MRQLIINRIKAITEYKIKNKIIPSEATDKELFSAVHKQLRKELGIMKNEGLILRVGQTVNGDEIIKLR